MSPMVVNSLKTKAWNVNILEKAYPAGYPVHS
jgi:hypothetical protein